MTVGVVLPPADLVAGVDLSVAADAFAFVAGDEGSWAERGAASGGAGAARAPASACSASGEIPVGHGDSVTVGILALVISVVYVRS